jgi:serine/threonine protein kinase
VTQPFADIFSSFLDGHASFEALQTALWNSLADNTASREQIAQTIESGFREGRLPFQVYFALKDALDNVPGSMAHAPAELGKDATRISSMPQPDATQIRRAAKGTEDRRGAEATQIRRAADETRIRPGPDRITTGPTTGTAPATKPGAAATVPPTVPPTAHPGATSASATGSPGSRTGPTDVRWSDPQSWPDEARDTLGIGSVLKNRFVLEEELGRGGMGRVYKALDRRKEEARDRNPYVAIKILGEEFKQHPDSFVALQREARRAQSLSHPNVVNVYDFDRDGPHVFMTMEYLVGQPLDRVIRAGPRRGTPMDEAWPIIQGVGEALAYGHKKGIVHSDFKPGNVFVCEDGTPKVLDFGISRPVKLPDDHSAAATLFDPGEVFGGLTEAYAALEMFQRQSPDPRDDIYALACVSYELLSGRHPFGRASALEAQAKNFRPRRARGLTPRQMQAIRNGLSFKREDRTPSVTQFLTELGPGGGQSTRLSRLWISGIAAAAAIAVALLVTTVVRINNQAGPASGSTLPSGPPPELTDEQMEMHEELLEEAALIIEDAEKTADPGSLIFMLSRSPNSATGMLNTVLDENPFDSEARKMIVEIGEVYAESAESLLDRGQVSTSLELVRHGLAVDGNSVRLAKIEREICRRAPDQCGN